MAETAKAATVGEKELSKRAARARLLYGGAWAALSAVYLAARLALGTLLGASVGSWLALLALQAVLGWAVLAAAGAFGDDAKPLRRGGRGKDSAMDYFALAAAAQLLHLWPPLASAWLLLLPPAVFAAHAAYSARESMGALASTLGVGGAAAGGGGNGGGGAAGGGAAGGGAMEGEYAGGGGARDGRTEEQRKKAEEKKRRQQEMQMKRARGMQRGGLQQRRKGDGEEGDD